jgi:hypothetical protein
MVAHHEALAHARDLVAAALAPAPGADVKVVINATVGGFRLSIQAVDRLTGLGWRPVYYEPPPADQPFMVGPILEWTGPDGVRYDCHGIAFRSHPDLVATVEALGVAASVGQYRDPPRADLAVIAVPAGLDLVIDESECGIECVCERARCWAAPDED